MLDTHLLRFGRESVPQAGSQRFLDELFSGTGMVTGCNPLSDCCVDSALLLDHRAYRRVVSHEQEQRRLVACDAPEEGGSPAGQPERYRGTKGL